MGETNLPVSTIHTFWFLSLFSHSTWVNRDTFTAWAQPEQFRCARDQDLPERLILGYAHASFYEAALVERAAGVSELTGGNRGRLALPRSRANQRAPERDFH